MTDDMLCFFSGLIPTTSYHVKVYGENVLGTSLSFTEVDFVTEGLVIPTPKLVHNEQENRLEVGYNSSDYCVKYQVCEKSYGHSDVNVTTPYYSCLLLVALQYLPNTNA